jgi:predicted phage tail component-like protein
MNKIIFKGIESTDIEGLLISELPPITKPKMRVQETTIDGVDGSIIEELGYESYDKELQIGLKGKFDIDKVIKYFSGEGNVVFSNEPDKFYKARIIEQIDYQRLLRFRTATIKFRVQPFKYLYNETYQKFENPVESIYALNEGLETAKPLIKINGTGTIEISIEDRERFSYTFPENETEVTIDSEKQDAYLGTVLKNRNMTGEFPTLKSGRNKINLTGNITEIYLIANSRWL